jgi:pyrroline-5-carboxylate reductase
MQDLSIGFLGAGNMAGALIKALLHGHATTADRILATDIRDERLEELHEQFGIQTSDDNAKVVAFSDVLVLSVKPQVVDKILPVVAANLKPGTLVVSIAAGVRLAALEARLPEQARVVRAMPNTPAMVIVDPVV